MRFILEVGTASNAAASSGVRRPRLATGGTVCDEGAPPFADEGAPPFVEGGTPFREGAPLFDEGGRVESLEGVGALGGRDVTADT